MTGPFLSLCMIVKDEAEMLPGCLESAAGVVDEIIVVDTGSSDATPQIAEAARARVIRHRWQEDFSEARNTSVDAATGDWILWMDADERLSPADYPLIRETLARAAVDAFLVPIINHTAQGQHIIRAHRLFRNRAGIRFSGRIHEQVSPALSALKGTVGEATFSIEHLGYALAADRLERKYERNRRLLESAKAQEPGNAYIRFTLAQNLLLQHQAADAERELEAALGRRPGEPIDKPLPADIRAAAFSNLAECAIARQAHEQALAHCQASLKVVPIQLTAHLLAYQAHKALDRQEAALRELQTVRNLLDRRCASGAAIEVHVEPGDLARAMGFCCLALKRPDDAAGHFQAALKTGTQRARTLAALARCAVARNDLAGALSLAEEAFTLQATDDTLLDLIAFILLKQGRFEDAAERLAQLCVRRPGDVALRRRLAGALVRAGRFGDAATILRAVNEREAESASSEPVNSTNTVA